MGLRARLAGLDLCVSAAPVPTGPTAFCRPLESDSPRQHEWFCDLPHRNGVLSRQLPPDQKADVPEPCPPALSVYAPSRSDLLPLSDEKNLRLRPLPEHILDVGGEGHVFSRGVRRSG